MTPERFGHYLLLKKLAEDPLGEFFRAAQIGDGGLERVVLLRVFNGSALEGRSLASHLEGRETIHGALRNPNIGMGLELGQVQGVPFVSYDYISGKNLGVLLDQIVQRGQAVPAEHALLVVERTALAVAVAYETRVADQRVVHGFLVPHLVMLSNEGETRVLGFEVGVGLRSVLSAALGTEYGRYLSPEALGGAALAPNDDVYSLGVLLLELLLGRRIPSPRAEGFRPGYPEQVEAAAAHGPSGIGELLRESLAPAGERIPEVVSWHRNLSQILADSGQKPTTFNLAFFMHSLFAEDIERETQELEAESQLDFAALVTPSGTLLSPTLAVSEPELTAPPVEVTGSHPAWSMTPATEEAPAALLPEVPDSLELPSSTVLPLPKTARQGPSLKRLLPALAIVLMLGGALGYWLWDRSRRGEVPPPTPIDQTAADSARNDPRPAAVDRPATPRDEAAAIDSAGAGGTSPGRAGEIEATQAVSDEQLMERLDAMVAQRTSAVEAALRQQYDGEIQALRSQLEESQRQQRATAAADPVATAPAPRREPSPPATDRSTPVSDPDDTDSGTGEDATDPIPRDRTIEVAGTPAATSPFPLDAGPTTTGASGEPSEPIAEPAPPSAPSASRERVQVGDLVVPGDGVVPPTRTSPIRPVFPPAALRLKREGEVTLEVLVDENGKVRDTRVIEGAGWGFDEAAATAARRTRFEPATKNGVRVRMWTRVKVRFENDS